MTDNDTRNCEEQLDEVLAAYLEAVESGWAPDRQRLLSCYPHLADDLARYFLNHDRVEDVTLPLRCVSAGELPASSVTMADTSPVSQNPRWPRVPGYLILEELGRGGMGVVFKARQVSCDRLVALKMVLAGEVAGRPERERFRNEVQAVARLQHTGIVQLYEVGEADGRPFFSMEYVAGGSLEDFLDGTPLPPREAARLIEQLARAVNAAHRAGIVHRDLKPANILLQKNPTTDDTDDTDRKKKPSSPSVLSVSSVVGFVPKVTDFGLAKRLDRQGQTVSGAIVGTPSYMAPEQAASRSKDIGPGTDVYALGALLYECLTGRPPFKAATVLDTVFQVLHEEPIAPSRLALKCPRDLETICLKCLQKSPGSRYAAAEDLAEDLHRFLDGTPIHARPAGAGARAVKWARRHPGTAALVTTCLLSFVALGVGGVWLAREASARAEAEIALARHDAEQAESDARRQKWEAESKVELARASAKRADRRLYASQVQLASQNLDSGQFARVRKDLELLRELDSAKDLRGFEWHYLDRQTRGATKGSTSLQAHKGQVNDVVFSPDGKQLATCGADQTVKVWDAHTGQETLTLKGHTSGVKSVAFSADGRRLVSSGADGSARLWEVATGKSLKDMPLLPAGDKVLSPDNKYVACFSKGGVRVWDVETGRFFADLPVQAGGKNAHFALGPGGQSLVVLRPEGGEVWDTATAKIVTRLTAPGGDVWAAAFRPDGKLFAVAAGGSVWVGETDTGKKVLDLRDQIEGALCLSFSPDGKRLAVGGEDRLVRLWDVATGLNVLSLKADDVVHTLTFSPNGLKLAAGNASGRVQLWDANPKP